MKNLTIPSLAFNNNYISRKQQKKLKVNKLDTISNVSNSINGLNALASINVLLLKKNNILFGAKDKNDLNRLKSILHENINLEELLLLRNENGDEIFTDYYKKEVRDANLNQEQIQLLSTLVSLKTSENKSMMPSILCALSLVELCKDKKQFELVYNLIKDPDLADDYLCINDGGFEGILKFSQTDEQIQQVYDLVFNKKDANNNPLFTGFDIANILSANLSEESLNTLYYLVSKKVSEDNPERPFRYSVAILTEFLKNSPNKEQIELLEKLVFDRYNDEQLKYTISKIRSLSSLIMKNPEKLELIKHFANISFDTKSPILSPLDIGALIGLNLEAEQMSFLNNLNGEQYNSCFGSHNIALLIMKTLNIKELDLNSAKEQVTLQKNKCLNNSQLYINGELNEDSKEELNCFFAKNLASLVLFTSILGKDTLNVLLEKRLDKASEYLETLLTFTPENIRLFMQMSKTNNLSDKPFSEKQKIGFIDLIKLYQDLGVSTDVIKNMIAEGRIDLGKLTKEVIKSLGFTSEEISKLSPGKLSCLDKEYIYLLSKEHAISIDNALKDYFYGMLFENNFIDYIHDETNPYGIANKNTKLEFKESGFNYEKWLQTSVEPIIFQAQDKNIVQLYQISTQVAENMQGLYNNGLKSIIEKRFKPCIQDGVFHVPVKFQKNKVALGNFISQCLHQLSDVKKQAEKNNKASNSKQENAQQTLMLLERLSQSLQDVAKVDGFIKQTKNLDSWSIKMWDRVNPNNIFQGNYSTCCIGIGEVSGKCMPHYVLNTAFNMIELVDNSTGDILGNVLCYLAKTEEGEPAVILDNIEIRNSNKPSDEVGIQLRTKIAEYAAKVAKEVTGKDDCAIYMSGLYNDVPYNDLQEERKQLSFLGDFDCSNIYTDLFGLLRKNSLKDIALNRVFILKEKKAEKNESNS